MARHARKNRRGIASLLISALLFSGVVLEATVSETVEPAEASEPAAACAPSGYTNGGITITPSHGQVFYIDSGQGQTIDASYAGYRIATSTNRTDLWVRVDGFDSGEVVQLADPRLSSFRIGAITSADSDKAAFFFLKASQPASTGQTHAVRVYEGNPDNPASTLLSECTYTFKQVRETIKAAANKLNQNGVSTTLNTQQVGETFTVTVDGQTGTIGAGSYPDFKTIWFSPAARSAWPAGSFELQSTQVKLYSHKSQRNSPIATYNNKLAFQESDLVNVAGYEATYTFKILGPVQSGTRPSPVAQISSGTQIKHTDMAGVDSQFASLSAFNNLSSVQVKASSSKSVSGSPAVSGSDAVIFGYKVTLTNNGTSTLSIDKIVDEAASELSMVTGSAFVGSTALSPFISGAAGSSRNWTIPGPFSIAAGQNVVISYQMYVPICQSTGATYSYSNLASAFIGNTQITSTATSITGVSSVMDCTNSNNPPATSQTAITQALSPAAEALATNNIQTTSAVASGFVDPNGISGQTVICEVSTQQNFSSLVSSPGFAATPSPTGAGTSAVATSCNLSGLSAGTNYYWRFRVGTNVLSNVLNFSTLPNVSGAPSAATDGVTGVSATSATVLGTITSNAQETFIKVSYFDNTPNGSNCSSIPGSFTTQTVMFDSDDNGTLDTNLSVNSIYPSQVDWALTGLTSTKWYCFRYQGHYPTISGTQVNGEWKAFQAISPQAPTVSTQNPAQVSFNGTTFTYNFVGTFGAGAQLTQTYFCYQAGNNDVSSCTTFSAQVDPIDGTTPTQISKAVSGLLPSTAYSYRAAASNASGTVSGSVVTFTTPAAPSAPTVVTNNPASVTTNSATLNGSIDDNGATTNATFCYQAAVNSVASCTSASASPSSIAGGAGNSSVSLAVTGLQPSTTYSFVVRGNNGVGGVVQGSIVQFRTLDVPPTVSTNPATNVTATTASLSGAVTAGSLTATVSFCVSSSSARVGGAGTSLQTCDFTITSANITNGSLSANGSATATGSVTGLSQVQYWYQAIVHPASGPIVYGGLQTFTPGSTPPIPTTIAANSITTQSAVLRGSITPGSLDANITFCYGTNADMSSCTTVNSSPYVASASTPVSVSAALTGLTSGATYFFWVIANDGSGAVTGSSLSFVVDAVLGSQSTPSPAPVVTPEETFSPCVQVQSLETSSTELLPYFAQTFQIMFSGAAGSVEYGLSSLANNDIALSWTTGTIATNNPLLGSIGALQSATEVMIGISLMAKSKPTVLEPTDVVLAPGANLGEIEITDKDGAPLELLSIQSIDLELYVEYTGAELNNPKLWQDMGYGLLCWKLEPFTETIFTLPNPIDLPAGTPAGNWVYSNVIVKAGSITTDPTTFQANTLFPKPGPGNAVWADVNGNGIYDPGGKTGDKAISHIVICADLLTVTPTPTQTSEGTPAPTTSAPATPAPTPTETTSTPVPTATPTPTQTVTPTPTATPTATTTTPVPATPAPPLTPTPTATPSPTSTVAKTLCPSPIPTNTTDKPKISEPTPLPTTTPKIIIKVSPLATPTPTPTTPGTSTPTPTPTTPGSTPTPSPTTPGSTTPTPTPTTPGTVTPSPTPTTPGTSTPTPAPTTPGATPTPTTPGTSTPTPAPTTPGATPTPTVPGSTPAPTPGVPGTDPTPTIDLSSPEQCDPDATYTVAMRVSNGLSTTCVRVTTAYFSFLAFSPRPLPEEETVVALEQEETLADTGAETTDLLLWALMLFGAGMVFTFIARRREE